MYFKFCLVFPGKGTYLHYCPVLDGFDSFFSYPGYVNYNLLLTFVHNSDTTFFISIVYHYRIIVQIMLIFF